MNFDNIHKKIDALKGRMGVHSRMLRPHALGVKSMRVAVRDAKKANQRTYDMLVDLNETLSELPPSLGVKSDVQALVRHFAIFDDSQQVVNYVNTIDRGIKSLERIQDALYKAESRIGAKYSRRGYNTTSPSAPASPEPLTSRTSRQKRK